MSERDIVEACEAMNRIAGAFRRRASERLRPFGITLAQYELISHLRRRGALAPSQAAEGLDWDRPTMAVVSSACRKAGWLVRSRQVQDRRSALIELSGRGEELLDRVEATKPFAISSFGDPFDVVGTEERALMLRLLDRVARRSGDLWGRF
ncbi:MAG TPA: MarR family transcriptional regulator [Rectinemataceae bacterium]|nr:MarR family transcriptional regulator [Rectinemataceae bacterium]